MMASAPWLPWVIAISASAAVLGVAVTLVVLLFKSGRWIGAVDSDRAAFKEFMGEVRADIKRLLNWHGSPTVGGASPLSLTEIGKVVSEALDLPALARKIAPAVNQRVSGMQAYDIQEFCFDYIRDEYQPDTVDDERIKQCAFEKGLDRDDILDALAIVLRDELLAAKAAS